MARPQSPFQAATFLLFCSFAIQCGLSNAAGPLLAQPHDGSRTPMVLLPLFLSHPNSSRASPNSCFRSLHESDQPNARMSLRDGLVINGYYTTILWIGTPPQKFALIVDTGSAVTYVPCSTCDQCGKHQDPKFQPEQSRTYQPLKCNIDCSCDSDGVQCVYEIKYVEMSYSRGVLGEDLVSFGNLSELSPQRVVFGCENVETGYLYSQNADGIMGLGRGDLSIVDQLVEKGIISDSFSLCYGGMENGGGAMVLGGISPPSDMVFTYSDPMRSPYYNIDLKELHIGGKPLPVGSNIFDGKYGSILDSGTTYAYLPEEAFLAFKDAIMKEVQSLKQISSDDPRYNDFCFSGAESDISQLSSTFPAIDIVFGNEQKLTLSPENYLFRHSKIRGAYCLGIYQNTRDSTTLLGGIVFRNTLVMYDREHSRIGFWKTNCSELWERLHLSSAPPPAPSTSKNQTIDVAAAPLPPEVDIPEILIGKITFDMSSSMKISYLKPRIAELAQFIAYQLDVNIAQVHLLSLNPKENGSLIKWAILPGVPGEHISKSTAVDIISRLSGHDVQLPDSFGSCQFTEWHVESPESRTRWKIHLLSVVLIIAVSKLRLLRRHAQQGLQAHQRDH